jgi:ribosome-associated translation inhibitor RaiA
MQLRIRAYQLELSPALRSSIERRLRLAVGRHVARVGMARITLSGEGGDASCRLSVQLRDGERLEIEDRAAQPLDATASAAWRLAHRLERRRANRTEKTRPVRVGA